MSQYRAYFVPNGVDPSGQQLGSVDGNTYPTYHGPGFMGPTQAIDGFDWVDYGVVNDPKVFNPIFQRHGRAGAGGLTIDSETLGENILLRIEGSHDIRSFKFGGCHCAKVFSAKSLRIKILSIVRGDLKRTTKSGFDAIHKHELRRVLVYRKAFIAYAVPWRREGVKAMQCGIVCRKVPGVARRLLAAYLDANQEIAANQFLDTYSDGSDSWVAGQQYEITKEHGYIKRDKRKWMDGFTKVHTVGQPPSVLWEPCP
jgi:hypothetical protein